MTKKLSIQIDAIIINCLCGHCLLLRTHGSKGRVEQCFGCGKEIEWQIKSQVRFKL